MTAPRTLLWFMVATALLAVALAPRSALAQASPARSAELPVSAYRAGPHPGIGIGPILNRYLALSKTVYGVDTRFFVNVGLAKALDVRFELTGNAAGSGTSYISILAPVQLRFNLGSVYSTALGFAAGMVTDTRTSGVSLGPEWSLLALRFGVHREFEVEVAQGLHFHVGRLSDQPDLIHFQSTLLLSYLFLDPPP